MNSENSLERTHDARSLATQRQQAQMRRMETSHSRSFPFPVVSIAVLSRRAQNFSLLNDTIISRRVKGPLEGGQFETLSIVRQGQGKRGNEEREKTRKQKPPRFSTQRHRAVSIWDKSMEERDEEGHLVLFFRSVRPTHVSHAAYRVSEISLSLAKPFCKKEGVPLCFLSHVHPLLFLFQFLFFFSPCFGVVPATLVSPRWRHFESFLFSEGHLESAAKKEN